MVLPRRRAAGLALGAGILFLVGTNVQAGWVLTLAAVLLGAALAGVLLPALMIRRVEVERRTPAEATAGEDVAVDLIVRNRGRATRLSLLLDDRFVAPASAFVPVLGPREEVRVATPRGPARRGLAEGTEIRLTSAAPFGVSAATRRIPATGRTLVLPRTARLSRLEILERPARPGQAPRTHPRHGHGQDFLGVREYRTGDSLRHVHWPSSARHGTLIVREFEREEPVRLAILLDTSADSSPDEPESALDLACAAAASAAMHTLSVGGSAALVFGASGNVILERDADAGTVLRELALAEAPGGVPVDGLGEPLSALRPEAVFAAVPTWVPNRDCAVDLVRALTSDGVRVQVLLVIASTFDRGTERAMATTDVPALAGALRGAGAFVSGVGAGDDLALALQGGAG